MRRFNTSGPNIAEKHYTIRRKDLLVKGLELVRDERYFTIWAPRQTGKSTYFRQLAEELEGIGYKVAHINFENYKNASLESFIFNLTDELLKKWNLDLTKETELSKIFKLISNQNEKKCVLIIDEVEGINEAYFGDFLHSIRNAYHSRETHCLKSVILVGVSNIVGVVSDNASPFNITDNLNVPYFTETGQRFHDSVKAKIAEITACQPGLANGFAKVLVEKNPGKPELDLDDYLKVEDWYLRIAIDKNFENILSKAKEERQFVERLLFTEEKIPFKIDRPSIKLLHTNGLVKDDGQGYVCFWVPFYKKRLHDAFYPYTNGEKAEIGLTHMPSDFYEGGRFQVGRFVERYKEYVRRRGFKPFLERDEQGRPKSIKESALIYSFETFISAIVQELGGKIYREADTGLGKSDLIVNIDGQEYLVETKVYSGVSRFEQGKRQLAYYARSLGLAKAVYLVFLSSRARIPETVAEQVEDAGGVEVATYLVPYDEAKW